MVTMNLSMKYLRTREGRISGHICQRDDRRNVPALGLDLGDIHALLGAHTGSAARRIHPHEVPTTRKAQGLGKGARVRTGRDEDEQREAVRVKEKYFVLYGFSLARSRSQKSRCITTGP